MSLETFSIVGQKVHPNVFSTIIIVSHYGTCWETGLAYLDFRLPVEHCLKGLVVGLRSNPGGAAVRLPSRI